MRHLQFLDFEICTECNRAKQHAGKCPSGHPERYSHVDTRKALDDDTIVEIVHRAYTEFDFAGLIGWHYYNEPLVKAPRVAAFMKRILQKTPQARFVLWTNGDFIPEDCKSFAAFEQIHISNYDNKDFSRVRSLGNDLEILPGRLDGRLDLTAGPDSDQPCLRPYVEMIIDYYGNGHICCMDWRGLATTGNVFTDGFDTLVKNHNKIIESVAGCAMTADAPAVCRTCRFRFNAVSVFDMQAVREACAHRGVLMVKDLPLRDTAVVITSYRVPTKRLYEYFDWNDELFRRYNLKVYVVTDQQHELPEYAQCLIFPDPMHVFNLAKTTNFGIRHAINAGHEVIIKSDVDITYPANFIERAMRCRQSEAIIPLYLMAENYEDRRIHYIPGPKAEGTVVTTRADWETLKYDENCEGYGAEDGILVDDLVTTGRSIDRSQIVWHIAHVPGTLQDYNGGRTDFWNRDNNFNPNNLSKNVAYNRKRRKLAKIRQQQQRRLQRSRVRIVGPRPRSK